MVRAICSQKVVDRKTTEEQMDMLWLKETIDRLATANGVKRYGHVLRRGDDSVLRVALDLEVSGKRKRGRPKKTWKKQMEEQTEKIGLKMEDTLNRDKWRDGVQAIAEGMGVNPAISTKGTTPDKKLNNCYYSITTIAVSNPEKIFKCSHDNLDFRCHCSNPHWHETRRFLQIKYTKVSC